MTNYANQLNNYWDCVFSEYGKGVILPTKNGQPDAKKLTNSTVSIGNVYNYVIINVLYIGTHDFFGIIK